MIMSKFFLYSQKTWNRISSIDYNWL